MISIGSHSSQTKSQPLPRPKWRKSIPALQLPLKISDACLRRMWLILVRSLIRELIMLSVRFNLTSPLAISVITWHDCRCDWNNYMLHISCWEAMAAILFYYSGKRYKKQWEYQYYCSRVFWVGRPLTLSCGLLIAQTYLPLIAGLFVILLKTGDFRTFSVFDPFWNSSINRFRYFLLCTISYIETVAYIPLPFAFI